MADKLIVEHSGESQCREHQNLEARIDELKDLLALRDAYLEDWKTQHPNTTLIVDLKIKVFELEEKARKPIPSDAVPSAGQNMEDQVTARVATTAFFAALVLLIAGSVVYAVTAEDKRVFIDYLSYALPLMAAVIAALSIYKESWKGRYFLFSTFLLFLGLDAYMMVHPKPYVAAVLNNFLMAVFMIMWLAVLAKQAASGAHLKALEKKKPPSQACWAAVFTFICHAALLVFLLLIVDIAMGVYIKVYPCAKDYNLQTKIQPNCYPIPLPSLKEAVMPWTQSRFPWDD